MLYIITTCNGCSIVSLGEFMRAIPITQDLGFCFYLRHILGFTLGTMLLFLVPYTLSLRRYEALSVTYVCIIVTLDFLTLQILICLIWGLISMRYLDLTLELGNTSYLCIWVKVNDPWDISQ